MTRRRLNNWVSELEGWLVTARPMTINIFLQALEKLKGQVPDALAASLIAHTCREDLGAVSIKDSDVIALATGLTVLIPDLVGVDVDKITVNASSDRVAAAVASQLELLKSDIDYPSKGE